MESYQRIESGATSAHESLRTEYVDPPADSGDNPYAVVTIPPIGRLLECICMRLSVGGCFRPGNRALADWLNYQSASQIPYLLSQLACEGWISYDPATRLITLLRTYRIDQAIRSIDRFFFAGADDTDRDDSAPIDPIDRDLEQQDAENENDQIDRSNPQRMEDHVLVAAADHDSESAAARLNNIPCGADSISPTDRAAALLLSELGTAPKLIAKALSKRPDLTPAQVRATWSHFEPRIKAGLCTAGAFHAAISNGQLHTAPPDPAQPIPVADYADDPSVMLGSDLAPPGSAESIRDHASGLLPAPTAATIREHTRDWMFLQCRLGAGDSDEAALAALEQHRKAVRR